jgi:leader peptidase (prepilin peptidase)/N-methyltransferase
VPTLSELPPWYVVVTAVAFGLVFGSFLNVVIYRLPRGENLAYPGSKCPACGTPIRAWDNVPVLGWVLLRGRARCCKVKISPRYPLVELLGGLVAWAVAERVVLALPADTGFFEVVAVFAAYLALGLGLVAATFIDLEHMILPDEITLGGAALGLLSAPLRVSAEPFAGSPLADFAGAYGPAYAAWADSLFGAVVGFLLVWLPFDVLYRLLRGRTGMALGDAKLLMLAGAWFGWVGVLFTLAAGAIQGTLFAIALLGARGKIEEPEAVRAEREALQAALANAPEEERAALAAELAKDPLAEEAEEGVLQARLPFGPFLALATLELAFFGEVIVDAWWTYVWAV